jgi:hypothetical protein
MNPQVERQSQVQKQSRRLASVVAVLFWALVFLLVLERFGWIPVSLAKGTAATHIAGRLGIQLGSAIAEIFYLAALYGIRAGLDSIATGELFPPILMRMLRRVGFCLTAGALAAVAAVPTIERLFGVGPGYWIAFDISGCTLGAVGMSFALLARVLDRASELKTELDEIF